MSGVAKIHQLPPPGRLTEDKGACAWCAVGLHEYCSSTAEAYAPCRCCGEKESSK